MNHLAPFSVLIANYNNGKYLQDAINSVLAQTYTHWEIVIVDDGSTDNSKEIISKYSSDNRFVIHYSERNMGCGYTKRKCVELANGEICGFLDADDVLFPDALEHHLHSHHEHPNNSCIFSRYYICDEQLNPISPLRRLKIPTDKDYFTNRDYKPEHFVSFKSAMYKQTSGIDPNLPAAVDQDLYFKLEEIAPIFILDKFTYKYRTTPKQISKGERRLKTLYWNLYVRHQTCIRRHLDPSDYPILDFVNEVSNLEQNLNYYKTNYNSVVSSKAYHLGKCVLRPFSWVRDFIRTLHN